MTIKESHIIFFICSLLGSTPGFCQSNINRWFQLRIAPLNILDPRTGVIQAGVEKRLGARIALSFDYGLKFDKLSFYNLEHERINYRYHKYKGEFKYFLKTKNTNPKLTDNPYMSLQGFYFPQQYRKDNSFLLKDGRSYHYDYSNINRKVLVASVLVGYESTVGKWVFDAYGGLGIRKLFIRHQPFHIVERARPVPIIWSSTPIDLYEGNFYRPHFATGVKVGYILGLPKKS